MIYLDNAATSFPKPEAVYQAVDGFLRCVGASPGRSGHSLSIEAARTVYAAREALAEIFGIDDPLRIVLTANATESLNLAMLGLLGPGDHAVTTSMEHNSVMRPLRALERLGMKLDIVPCSAQGLLDPADVERALRPETRLIVMTHASNVSGAILPVAEVGEIARRRGVPLLVDAAQTAGCCPIDVRAMNIALLAFSGHKGLLGPPGTGGLYIRQGLEQALAPLCRGGTGSFSEHEEQPDFLPDKYESGTPNGAGIAGLGAGARFVLSQGVAAVRRHEQQSAARLIEGLGAIPGVTVHGCGDPSRQAAVVSFSARGMVSSTLAGRLDEQHGIMCRPGLHCAPAAHRTMGTFPQGAVRLSPGLFTTGAELDATLKAIQSIVTEGR